MSSTSNPYGFRPLMHFSGGVGTRDVWAIPNGISAAYNTNILQYQPVYMQTSGVIAPVTSAVAFMGVMLGVQYTPTAGGRPIWLNYWPASTAFVAGSLTVYVTRDVNMLFKCQADGSLAQTAIGDECDTSNFTNGSTTTGFSTCSLGTVAGAGNQAMWRIEALLQLPTNAWGDAYTDVIVSISRSQFTTPTVAI